MSAPQVEDGYTRIANELLDEIIRHPFSKRQIKVLLAVVRQTYGYNRKSHAMSYSVLADATGLFRRHVISTVAELAEAGVLVVEGSGVVRNGGELKAVGVNKRYTEWRVTGAETVTSPKTVTSAETVTRLVLKQSPELVLKQSPIERQERQIRKTGKNNSRTGAETVTSRATLDLSVLPPDLSTNVWSDFLAHRRGKRAPVNTQTVVNTVAKELEKARAIGWSPDAALAECMSAGWQGLKAEWLERRANSAQQSPPQNRQVALEQSNRAAAAEAAARIRERERRRQEEPSNA